MGVCAMRGGKSTQVFGTDAPNPNTLERGSPGAKGP
jgi:hypothetical protein